METPLNLRPILSFLEDLSTHNNKVWFDEHRPAYETARDTFEQFVDVLIDHLRASDQLQGVSAKDCVARINRDIRFSKDKSPYKTNFGATIAPGGRKATRLGYHISLAPQAQSLVAGGLYMPTPEQLTRFREAIDKQPEGFKKLTRAKAFVEAFGAIGGERLKTAPQGYDRAHPEIELLQLKQVVVVHHFSDAEVLAHDFPRQVVAVCRAMKPFLDYLNGILA
jgi:uncharacterized protein (TIGR02453 family)